MPRKTKLVGLAIERRTDETPPAKNPFPFSTAISPLSITLPPEAQELAVEEQALARSFLTAWRRTHEFLLEAARWMSEARAQVDHGHWGLWLRVVGISDDVSEQLRHIWWRAQEHTAFADAIRQGRINTTTAGLLAPPTVPTELIDEVLSAEQLPKTKVLQRRISAARQTTRNKNENAPLAIDPTSLHFPSNSENAPQQTLVTIALSSALRSDLRNLIQQIQTYTNAPATLMPEDWALLHDLLYALQQLAIARRQS